MATKSGGGGMSFMGGGMPLREIPIPDPRLPVYGFRLAVVVFLLFVLAQAWQRPAWEGWGRDAITAVSTTRSGQTTPNTTLRLGGALVRALYSPIGQARVQQFTAGVLAILLFELGTRLIILTRTVLTPTRERTRYYRVRVLSPTNRTGFPASSPLEQIQALATAMRVLPAGSRLALSLTRTPNEPATLGVQISTVESAPARTRAAKTSRPYAEAEPLARSQKRTSPVRAFKRRTMQPVVLTKETELDPADRSIREALRALTSALKRFDETVQIDPMPDPLAAALAAEGSVLLVREFALAWSPHWPLQQSDAKEGDVLRSVAQSLAASQGVRLHELQIAIAPARLVTGMRWYGLARRAVQRIRKQAGPMGTDDQKAISAKVADRHVWATVRVVVVVASPEEVPLGRESLRVMESALRSLDRRTQGPGLITVEQRLRPITGLAVEVMPAAALAGGAPRIPAILHRLLLVLTVAVGILIVARITTSALGISSALPGWANGVGGGLLLATYALAGGIGGWAAVRLRPWFTLARIGRPPLPLEPMLLLGPGVTWHAPDLLGAAELASLWHLSNDETATEMTTMPNRFIAAPASAFVPDGATDWVVLGTAYDSGGAIRPVGLPLKALHQMMHVTAGMGAGKSQAAAAMCAQLIPHGFIILDGKGDDEGGGLAAVVRRLVPPEDEHRLFYLNVLETAFPIGLNPIYDFMVAMEEATSKAARDLAFNAALGLILGLFQRLDPERWDGSPGMQQYALMGCHLVLRTGSSKAGEIPTMAKVSRVLEDETYRKQLLARYPFRSDTIYRFWTEREEQLSESQKSSLSALLRRLDLFMANPITRPMLTVERPSIDLRRAMDEGQIVLIPMPHRSLGGLAPLVGMLVLQSIVAAAYARKGDALTRTTAPVFIDEVQVFVVNEQSPDLEQAFTQLRGFAVPLIVLHQTLDQIGALKSTFTINAANRLILRTGEPDASEYAKMYSQASLSAEDIKAMHALHHQYAVTLGPNREQLVFSLIPNQWPPVPSHRLPPHLGSRDWQARTPPAAPDWTPTEIDDYAGIDRLLASIIYRDHAITEFERITAQLALLPELLWATLLEQWERVRACHYQYILDAPAVIPDQQQRQTWLTNLVASRGAVIEEALILRQELRLTHAEAAPTAAAVAYTTAQTASLSQMPQDLQPGDAAHQPPPTLPPGPSADDVARRRGVHPEEKPGVGGGLTPPEPPPAEGPDVYTR